MTEAPRRVRVTAPESNERAVRAPVTRGIALPGSPVDEADAVYARALQRSQLRLALGSIAGFILVAATFTVLIAAVPALDEIVLFGIPLTWLLHAFVFYPVILVFALLYARSAARNERRYRALRDPE